MGQRTKGTHVALAMLLCVSFMPMHASARDMTVTAGYGTGKGESTVRAEAAGATVTVDAVELARDILTAQVAFGGWYMWDVSNPIEVSPDIGPHFPDLEGWLGTHQTVQLVLSSRRKGRKPELAIGAGMGYHQQWPREERGFHSSEGSYYYEERWGKPSTLWRGQFQFGLNIPTTARSGLLARIETHFKIAEGHQYRPGPKSQVMLKLGYRFPLI